MISYMRNLAVVYACTPSLGYAWNLGSFLGLSLVVQVVTGLLLLLNYNSLERFEAIQFILYEVQLGWLMKIVHSNNASMIFILLYLHLYKNLAVSGYRLRGAWNSGITMMLIIIGAAFTGYVLVGSQMRFWAAMVITRLLRVVPLVGERVLYSVWGGYSIRWVTYQTMLVVHFILPFIVLGLLVIHLNFLHYTGSTRSSLTHSSLGKVTFYPYYWGKDAMNLVVYLVALFLMVSWPYALREVELYEEANAMSSPVHIVPEWYFTAQYAILRRVPSKGAGVILMVLRIAVLYLYPFTANRVSPSTSLARLVWVEALFFQAWLRYLGTAPISQPYVLVAQIRVLVFFTLHLALMGWNVVVGEAFSLAERSVGPSLLERLVDLVARVEEKIIAAWLNEEEPLPSHGDGWAYTGGPITPGSGSSWFTRAIELLFWAHRKYRPKLPWNVWKKMQK